MPSAFARWYVGGDILGDAEDASEPLLEETVGGTVSSDTYDGEGNSTNVLGLVFREWKSHDPQQF